MNGPREGVIPDVVEQEVGNFYRTFFKLERAFIEIPNAKQMAMEVRRSKCLADFLLLLTSVVLVLLYKIHFYDLKWSP